MFIRYVFTIKDAYNRKTTKTFNFNDSIIEVARPAILDLIQDMDAIIAGQIVSVQETTFLPLQGIKTNPIANCNIDEAFVFVGELNDPRRTLYSLRVPTPKKAYVSQDGSVDLEQVDIRNFLDDFTGTVHIPVSDGERVMEFFLGKLEK